MSHVSESTDLRENSLTQLKGVDIYTLLFCCGKFCIPVHESFYKKLPVCWCKRLGIAALAFIILPFFPFLFAAVLFFYYYDILNKIFTIMIF